MRKIRNSSATCRKVLGSAALGLLLLGSAAGAAPPTPGPGFQEELLWIGTRTEPVEAPAALAPAPAPPAEATAVERRRRVADLLKSFAARPLPAAVQQSASAELPGPESFAAAGPAAAADDALYQPDDYDEDAFDLLD